MVRHLIFLLLLLPTFLFSGEFKASVSSNQVHLGESFTLNLTLKGTSAKGAPAISSLTKSFVIHSQQQSSNTVITNGQITSNINWKLILIPQGEGEAAIPSISIDTSEGTLSSEPIMIRVLKGTAAAGSDSSDTTGVTLTTDVSNAKPYKNEMVVYTIRLISKQGLANIKMQKIDIEDAIVETDGKAKIYEKVADGIRVNVLELSYFITPLKAGLLKIPSTTIQGGVAIKQKAHNGSFFDDNFDPFSMMQGFNRLKPFALTTEEVVLDVQPAIAGMNPWLPAKSLKIEEVWNESQPLQAGEFFTRSFKIVAEGIKSNQLPSLNDLQISDSLFKIYADKPELGDEEKEGSVKSYRKEQYTLIPQQSGTLTLPEISLAWWDVTKKEKVFARIPSRTLQILPASESTSKSTMVPAVEMTPTVAEPQAAVVQRDPLLYALIAGLAVVLFIAIFWAITLQKRIVRLTGTTADPKKDLKNTDKHEKYPQYSYSDPEIKPPPNDKNKKLPDLNPT
jgi:BatD DUF11 like domain